MKHYLQKTLALLLAFLMLFEVGEMGIAFAVEDIDRAVNPAKYIELTVPEKFQDGGNWFFIPEAYYSTSEKSTEKLYIPIQRTGDLDAETEVTLKVTDLSARHDVNYTVEIYKETIDPEIVFDDQSIVALIQSADGIEEIETAEDESALGELVYENGGADLVDGEGNTIATITATPLDENGNPIVEETETPAEDEALAEEETTAEEETAEAELESEPETEAEVEAESEDTPHQSAAPTASPEGEAEEETSAAPVIPGEVTETEWTEPETEPEPERERELSATERLRAARDAYTGTTSDRQELSSSADLNNLGQSLMSEDEYNQAMADAVQEDYPGKEYRLTFAPGEETKFLVITPLYSEAAEGDAMIMLMLKDPAEGYAIGEDVNPVSIVISDEDEPESVYVDMAYDTVVAENGKAVITVNRAGRINALKGVMISSWDGSAEEGKEYSGIGAKLYFSMGLTTRSVEIPVYHGTVQKDFYVAITALSDEQITRSTTHVIIPAADQLNADGELLGIAEANGHPFTDPIYLKNGWFDNGGFDTDTSFHLFTHSNKKETVHYWLNTAAAYGYAYDGMYVHFNWFLNWCDAEARLSRWNGGSGTNMHYNYEDDGGEHNDHWLYGAWNAPKAPDQITIEAADVDVEGIVNTDSYVAMWVDEVRLIKRQFEIKVEPAEVKPHIGVDDNYVLTNYEAVYLDGNTKTSQTHWTEDSFSLTAKTKGPLRLVGMDARAKDGTWVRIATIDGKSSSVVVNLTVDNINVLQGKDVIFWSENGSCDFGGSFYKGTITVRPVFDYINATVEVVADQDGYGSLNAMAPQPSLVWDFGSDNNMHSVMSDKSDDLSRYVSRSGSGTVNGYYSFYASGGDPYIFIGTPYSGDASNLQWVKIKARHDAGADVRLQLFASCTDMGWYGYSCQDISLASDSAWHEYVVQVTNENWKNSVNCFRLDPLAGCESGKHIDIDYIAFFQDEAGARQYQPGNESGTVQLTPGTYTYHLGDVLSFTTTLSAKGETLDMQVDGVQYELRAQGNTGDVVNSNLLHYINGTIDLRLSGESSGGAVVDRPYYKLKPTFTQAHNQLVVNISDADYAKLDATRGILAEDGHVSVFHEDGVYRIVVAKDVLANDVYTLDAYTPDDTAIPSWETADGTAYSGEIFYALTNPLPEENVITLTVPNSQGTTYMVLSGTIATATFNMNTERSATDINLAENAWVSYGGFGTLTNDEGDFQLPAIRCANSTRVRFLVDYNGVTSVKEAIVPGKTANTFDAEAQVTEKILDEDGKEKVIIKMVPVKAVKVKAGTVMVESFSENGAHFESVFVQQSGRLLGAVDAMSLNGKKLEVEVQVAGGQYVLENQTYTEHIQDVTLFFMDQYTGAEHGMFSSNETPDANSPAKWTWTPNETGGVFKLEIPKFSPDQPNLWTYGDVLMCRLTTDKRTVTYAFTGQEQMRYEPVSTGYAVISDPDYKAQVFEFDVDDFAEMFNVEPASDEDGELLGDDQRASFGAFPYIGEITAAVHVFHFVASSLTHSAEMSRLMGDLASMSLDDEEEAGFDWTDADMEGVSGAEANSDGKGGAMQNILVDILIKFDETYYGGVRFMLGVIFSYGGGAGYRAQKNPFKTAYNMKAANLWNDQVNASQSATSSGQTLINTNKEKGLFGGKKSMSLYGGLHFEFHAYVGVYIDFGFIELKELDANGNPQKSHDCLFMGAGGFLGFGASVGYTWYFCIPPGIPAYINLEAGLDLSIFLGTTADPNATLDSYQSYDDFLNADKIKGQDYSFNFDFKGKIYAGGSFGIGIYKILGVRVNAEVVFEFGYSNKVCDWWPQLFDTGWGYVMEAGFSGTVDLLITSIDVYSASWPLPVGNGYLRYFQEVRRANKCVSYVETGIEDGHGTQADRDAAYQMCRELEQMVDAMTASREQIEEKTTALKEFAKNHDIITWTTANAIEMNKQGGLVGTALNTAQTLGDDGSASGVSFHTNPHVHSSFVGNDAQLMSAYGPVQRTDVVTDAYAQPSSQIIAIGGGRYLMVYLDDTLSRDRMQASTLKWTVYNAADGSFTEPQTVQNDSTADSRPHLADAGDRIILSWASATDEKLDALKSAVAAELEAKIGAAPSDYDVQEALEADPARVLSIFDIFSVEFDKAAQSFGAIAQLTDDEFYDDYPQAVYDAETTDYIVLYTKTAQDSDDYSSAGDALNDLIGAGPDPDRTYSVVSYRLYNGAQEEGDPFPAGWVEGFYPNELPEGWTSEEYYEAYGPERFLASTIVNDDGSYADPPISDLTVAAGLNHLAAFAFTVDMDYDMDTTEDKALYVQYYNFNTHSPYYPIRVAGDRTETWETYNDQTHQRETRSATVQVDVGAPRLIRSGGSTFLFWRENGDTLKYLNISELLNIKVPAVANPSGDNPDDWTYAVRSDGTFATDAMTGEVYTPRALQVDFGSPLNDSAIEITEYNVITDEDDNLYVVWTDSVAKENTTTSEPGESFTSTAQEIYATAMIRQSRTVTVDNEESTDQTARWSKPYRITRDEDYNDGVALALDPDGGLIIAHNRYGKLTAKSTEEAKRLVQEGKIGLTFDKEGNPYAATLTYNSPVTLSITRCEKIGSLEATQFDYTDYKPVAGETITVTAAIENVGLLDAQGCELEFYEYRDGVQGRKIAGPVTYDQAIPVNTANTVSFQWTVPADGPEGYSIEAVIREKKADGGYYNAISSFSDAFTAEPDYAISITDAVQDGDQFRVSYRVANRGNAPAEAGTTVSLELEGLYGDLDSTLYGYVKDNVLYSADITDRLPAKTVSVNQDNGTGSVMKSVFEDEQYVTIPASVFRHCGYDAITLSLYDANGKVLATTSQKLVAMAQPMNLSLNGGKNLSLKAGKSAAAPLSYDTTAFINNGAVIYTTADPNVAEVDEDGNVTGIANGTTTLTATVLPSGRSASITVTVSASGAPDTPTVPDTPTPTEEPAPCDGSESCPLSAFTDLNSAAWYHDGVHWALENSVMQGVGKTSFAPNETTTRAMLVTMLYRLEGEPATDYEMTFTDVEEGKWYTEAIRWAAANEIVKGYNDETFGPMNELTREQLAAILYRYAKTKGQGFMGAWSFLLDYDDADQVSDWAYEAMCWMTMQGVIRGIRERVLSSKTGATRAQVATMLMRFEALEQ